MSTSAYAVPYELEYKGGLVSDVDPTRLWSTTPQSNKPPPVGTVRILFNTPPTKVTAISSLGENFSNKSANERRELLRKAVGSAVKELKILDGLKDIVIDASRDPQAAAVAAHLALYKFSLKTNPPSPFNPFLKEPIPDKLKLTPLQPSDEWHRGVVYASAQNFCRTLMELPANLMTPTIFTERVKAEFSGLKNAEIIVHDEAWAEEMKMNTFLSVTHGTSEPAKILEIHYTGANSKDAPPLALVGKGITFDSGGISLKPGPDMKAMRADMGGAAAVVSAMLAAARLQLPVNIVVVTPLTENMPGPGATKPGDIVYAMNGKSVEIDNTDSEGRLVLSDAIYYASTTYKPHTLVDVATLTSAIGVALGRAFTGVFSTSDDLWERLRIAGETEYDRFWRMPLDEEYGPQIYSSNADLQNNGGTPAGSCTAALFLKHFVDGIEAEDGKEPRMKWAHIDISGFGQVPEMSRYYERGMTGRPVRALVEFIRNLAIE